MIEACIPMPVQVVIDDVGWRMGENGSEKNQPYRTGLDRLHMRGDYEAIASLGKQLNMRPQAAMILGEWDTLNLIRKIPTASWMGSKWDSSHVAGRWVDEAVQVLSDHRSFIEITLHGIMHEYWVEGQMTRAEWADEHGEMRPQEEVLARLDLFGQLLEQHGLGPMPRSFVPCAFHHRFGDPDRNIARLLSQYGLTSMSTPFAMMAASRSPEYGCVGFDEGLMVVDRGMQSLPWYQIEPDAEALEIHTGPIIGTHWANFLHRDPKQNEIVVERWVKMLRQLGARFDRVLSRDTDTFNTQLMHHRVTQVEVTQTQLCVDATDYFKTPWADQSDNALMIKWRETGSSRVKVSTIQVERDSSVVRVAINKLSQD